MEAGIDAGGEHITPFSKFVDRARVSTGWKAQPASPATVTNVAVLPLGQTKKNIKLFLRERLFPPNHDIRSVLFKSLSKRVPCNRSMFSQQMYNDFITESCPTVSNYADVPLPSFVTDEEDVPSYYLNDSGKLELRRILLCVNHHFPHIVFCPILPAITALFLHYDDSPSQVFSHVCHILTSTTRHAHYIDQTKAEVEASTSVLKDLIQRFASSSHKTLVNLATNPDDIYSQWLKVLFHGLPFSYLVIVFDMYLLEGYKSLLRAAIAVLKFYRKVGLSNPSDILSAVFEFVKGIDTKVSTNLLFKKAYSLKLPNSKDIRKLHQKYMSVNRRTTLSGKEDTKQERYPWRYISIVRNVTSAIMDETMLSTLYCWIPERYSFSKPTLLFSTDKDGYRLEAFFRAAYDRTPSILAIKTTEDFVIGAFLTSDWSERKDGKNTYFGTGETFLFTLSPEYVMYPWVGIKEAKNTSAQGASKRNEAGNPSFTSINSSASRSSKSLPPARALAAARSSRGVTLPPIHSDSVSPSLQSPNRDSREGSVVLPPIVGSPITLESLPSLSSSSIAESTTSDKIQSKHSSEKLKNNTELYMFADDNSVTVGGGNGFGLHIDSTFRHCSSDRCDTFENNALVPGTTFECSIVELFGFSTC